MFVTGEANWDATVYDFDTKTQTFTSKDSNKKCDLKIYFESGTVTVDYFENGSSSPTRTKTLIVEQINIDVSCRDIEV